MDLQRQKKMGGFDSTWTNEKHLSFLDSMEASFVRRMFENDDRYSACTPHHHLERYLPEGADSTLDFEHHNGPGKTLDLTPEVSERRKLDNSSKIKKRRTGSCVPDNPSTDQVVPYLANEKRDGLVRERR